MVSIIKTVSLTSDEAEFLELNNLSPTALLKAKIDEIKTFRAKPLLDKIERLSENLQKAINFIQEKELIDDYLSDRGVIISSKES